MAKKLPKPFVKPSITLDQGVNRRWKEVPISSVQVGDIVPDVGRVKDVQEIKLSEPGLNPHEFVRLTNFLGDRHDFSVGTVVLAFVK